MSTRTIGPDRAAGWQSQFGYQNQFGASPNNFQHGAGTLFPFPSMPLAQAARYWWAVKQWRVQWSFADSFGDTSTLDTGFIPYPCGKSQGAITPQSSFAAGDRLVTPSVIDRYLPAQAGDESYFFTLTNGIMAGFDDGTPPAPATEMLAFIKFFGSAIPGYPLTSPQSPIGLVWDDSTPGNVFMLFGFFFGFWQGNFGTPISTIGIGSSVGNLTLDGMTAPLYSGVVTSANITITTKDT